MKSDSLLRIPIKDNSPATSFFTAYIIIFATLTKEDLCKNVSFSVQNMIQFSSLFIQILEITSKYDTLE